MPAHTEVQQSKAAPRNNMVPSKMPLLDKAALEEAFQPPYAMESSTSNTIGLCVYPERAAEYTSGVGNIQDCVFEARDTGVSYSISSLTVPGVQGETDPATAEAFATNSNNWIAEQIKAYPTELDAFGAVSMHNPKQAIIEITRCIKELGFHGIMINNWQQAGFSWLRNVVV